MQCISSHGALSVLPLTMDHRAGALSLEAAGDVTVTVLARRTPRASIVIGNCVTSPARAGDVT